MSLEFQDWVVRESRSIIESKFPKWETFTRNYFKDLGYKTVDLAREELLFVFAILNRLEEIRDPRKHRNHNWDIMFRDVQFNHIHQFPILDKKRKEWEFSNRLIRGSKRKDKFRVWLTHDIDIVSSIAFRERWRSLLKGKRAPTKERVKILLSAMYNTARRLVPNIDSRDCFKSVISVEEDFNVKSTLFVCAHYVGKQMWDDVFYRLDDKVVFDGRQEILADVFRSLTVKGWEIGCHGSWFSHVDGERLKQEIAEIHTLVGCDISIVRNHHLTYDVRTSPLVQVNAGVKADSTIGSNENIGFRCGTCFPYKLCNYSDGDVSDLVEIPMILQDCALGHECGYEYTRMRDRAIQIIEQVENQRGLLTVLWHNQHAPESTFGILYRELVDYCVKRGANFVLGKDVLESMNAVS